jgi:DNA-binding protein H-NS
MFGPRFCRVCPVDERKRDSIVAYLRRRMDEFGITVDDLAALMAADTPAAARYRNAHGDAWDGNVKCLNG